MGHLAVPSSVCSVYPGITGTGTIPDLLLSAAYGALDGALFG